MTPEEIKEKQNSIWKKLDDAMAMFSVISVQCIEEMSELRSKCPHVNHSPSSEYLSDIKSCDDCGFVFKKDSNE